MGSVLSLPGAAAGAVVSTIAKPLMSGSPRRTSVGAGRNPTPQSPLAPGSPRGGASLEEWPSWLSDSSVAQDANVLPRRLSSYERLEKIGSGTYSVVYKCLDLQEGKIVALKRVRVSPSDAAAVAFALREVEALRRVDHPHVLRLRGLALAGEGEPEWTREAPDSWESPPLVAPPPDSVDLYLVLDWHPCDLAGVLASRGGLLREEETKALLQQLLQGLAAAHAAGLIHRDLKLSNLLISQSGQLVLADWGMAALVQPGTAPSRPPRSTKVTTLWYRPPELLLGSSQYGTEVDLWSVGCLAAELHTGRPLIPGQSESKQLQRILQLCGQEGSPMQTAATGSARQRKLPAHLRSVGASEAAVAFIDSLMALSPHARPTAAQALQSAYFTTAPLPLPPGLMPQYPAGTHELALRRRLALAKAALHAAEAASSAASSAAVGVADGFQEWETSRASFHLPGPVPLGLRTTSSPCPHLAPPGSSGCAGRGARSSLDVGRSSTAMDQVALPPPFACG